MSARDGRRRGAAATLMAFAMSTLILGIVVGSGAEVAPMAVDARRAGPEQQALVLAEAAICAALDDLAARRDPVPFEGERLGRGTASLRVTIVNGEGGRVVLEATGAAPAPLLLGPGGTIRRRLRVVVGPSDGAPPRIVAWEELP